MKDTVLAVEGFLDAYVRGSAIKSVIFNVHKDTWIVEYINSGLRSDEFDDFETMIKFLHADQNED
jgi:hypothetical protein